MQTDVNCSICENEIECQSTAYSLVLIKEYFENDSYYVKNSSSYMTACWDCFIKNSIEASIDSNLYNKLCLIHNTDTHDNKVQAINSHYECFQCREKIADSSYISTVNHYLEEWIDATNIQPIEVTLVLTLCSNCSEETKLVVLLEEVVRDLISSSKRKLLKLV